MTCYNKSETQKILEAAKKAERFVFKHFDTCAIDWIFSGDFPASDNVIQRGLNLLHRTPERLSGYTTPKGLEELREEVVHYFHRKSIVCSDENIWLGTGIYEQIPEIYRKLKPRDGTHAVLIPTPSLNQYSIDALDSGAALHFLKTDPENDFKFNPQDLAVALEAHKPSFFIFTNPANPTGAIYNPAEIDAIATVLSNSEVIILADEIFSDVCHEPDVTVVSLASYKNLADRTITMSGASKSLGLAGSRVSYACVPAELVPHLHCPPCGYSIFDQTLVAEALKDHPLAQERHQSLRKIRKENRDYVTTRIRTIEGVEVIGNPEAGSFICMSFKGILDRIPKQTVISASLDLGEYFVERVQVAIGPGEEYFFPPEEMIFRVPLTKPLEEFERGFDLIEQALRTLLSQEKIPECLK